jgi:hypothetical protein
MPVLDGIPAAPSVEDVVRSLRLSGQHGEAKARELLEEARPLLRPRALYREAFIEEKGEKGEGWVRVQNLIFTSGVLRGNLEPAEKVFPFVLTVGSALEEAAGRAGDLLRQFSLETVADLALYAAGEFLEGHLRRRYGFEKLSSLSPGSLEDWPITEQRGLFALLGDPEAEVGVRLSPSLLMIPRKSISGIFFPTEESFFSCQLCGRDRCPGRRAPFDPGLRQKYDEA